MKKLSLLISYLIVFLLGVLIAPYIYGSQEQEITPQIATPTPHITNYSPLSPNETLVATGNIVAVRSSDNNGTLGKVIVEIKKEGRGRVLINTNPFVEPDTQYSAETAIQVAQNLTGKSLADLDVIISFQIEGRLIGGPSAGAAIAATAVAAIEGKQVRQDAVITGTIEEDGSIGQVGGIFEKAFAAFENNATLFLIPKGQSHTFRREMHTEEKRIGGFIYIYSYEVLKPVNLIEYAKEQWNMEVKEVSNIREAVSYLIEY
ncbi:MAG: S16 family serine protease [Methanocellales archaeon]